MNRFFTFFASVVIFVSFSVIKINAQCTSWIPRDSVFGDSAFSYVPFVHDSDGSRPVAPYYRNDDGVTNAIVLPFHFCFWGKMIDSVYINCNGNISFGQQYSSFLSDPADTFPLHNYEMIAPFWADVYTRTPATPGSNVVIYKIQAHYMIVQWDSVAYYAGETTKFNSFQVIISDGTDPIIPAGNNVSFAYRQMQWTTGNASGGTIGFGGHPAIVGANEGDDVRYLRIGMFASAGTSYFGQFPPPPNYDEVGWLDNKSFLFNLCSGSIAPLISGISPCDTFRICEGDSISIPLEYYSVIQGDTSWSNLVPPVESGVRISANYPGPVDSLRIEVVGSAANAGDHTINLYGYDNQHPSDTTYSSFVIEIGPPPHITLSTLNDTICAGGTATLTASGGTTYSWSNGIRTSTISVSPTSPETYTVEVSNGGCVKDTTVKVDVLPAPTPSINITPNPACQGDTVLLIGLGGGPYVWSTTQTTDTIKVVSTLTTTVYSLSTSNGTCSGVATATVTAIPKITATSSIVDSVVCPHSASILTITSSSSSATYKWSSGQTTSSITVNDTVSTTYTATVYGVCDTLTFIKHITVLPSPTPTIDMTPDSVCQGDTVLLIGMGGGPYVWSTTQTSDTIKVVSTLTTNVYTLTVSNGSCSGIATVPVTAIPKITATITAGSDTLSCPGGSTTLKAVGSGGAVTYKWSNGQTGASISVTDTGTETYTVTVYGICDSVKVTQKVTVVPLPVLSLTGNPSPCEGGKDTITISSSTNPTSYLWSNGTTSTSYYTGAIDGDSTISVTAENSLGCPSVAIYPITEKPYPVVTLDTPPLNCGGAPVILTATTSGAGSYTYTWLPAGTGNTSSVTVTPVTTTTYTVIVSNGCSTTKKVTITPDIPALSACCPAIIILGGDTTITTIGNMDSLVWSPANSLNCDTCPTVIATPTITTTYTVTGKDAAGCPATSYVTIIVDIPCVNLIVPNVFTPTIPGPDGLNSLFYINTLGDNLNAWSLTVFDRWGKEVYTSTNPKQYWSGNTESGGTAPAGVYYYIISATCQSTTYKKDGFVQLIR